jgi:hypothetical protein
MEYDGEYVLQYPVEHINCDLSDGTLTLPIRNQCGFSRCV